jgi:hypothetical protein
MADEEKSTPEALRGCKSALSDLLRTKKIGEETYCKGVIDLAYRWVEIGGREEAQSLIDEVEQDYIDNVLRFQLHEDPEFAAHALVVATYLDPLLPKSDEDEVEMTLMLLERPEAKA